MRAFIGYFDVLDAKLEMARHFGATHTINLAKQDLEAEVKKLTGTGVDASIIAVPASSRSEMTGPLPTEDTSMRPASTDTDNPPPSRVSAATTGRAVSRYFAIG